MNKKGGRTSTTWTSGSKWKSGETKTVRVPIALEEQIMAYARNLDEGEKQDIAEIFLSVIDRYIEMKRQIHHPNQHSKKLDINTRAWDEMRKLRKLLQENPQVLGLGIDVGLR